MEDFADLLKYIIPLVIFIGAAIFGKSDKQKAGSKHGGQSGLNSILDLIEDDVEMSTIPHSAQYSESDIQSQQPQEQEKTEPMIPNEGERAVFVETHNDTPAEPEKPDFDARAAIIYSTILERKY